MSVLLNVIAPVFGVMGLGALSVKMRVLDEGGVRGLVLFVFNFAIPILLFRNLAQIELPPEIQWSFLLSYFGAAILVYLGGMTVGRIGFGRNLPDMAIFGMASAFSNTVLIGIPILFTAYGSDATLPTLLIIAFHGPVLMSITAGLVQVGQGGSGGFFRQAGGIGLELLRNPILMGILLGLIVNLGAWVIPEPVDRLAEMLGAAAVPCSLFALGASLVGHLRPAEKAEARSPVVRSPSPTLALSALKLLVHPVLVWVLAVPVFGLEGIWVKVAVTMAAMPSGINVYLFGARYHAAPEIAARTVFLTNLLSIGTLSLVLFIFAG